MRNGTPRRTCGQLARSAIDDVYLREILSGRLGQVNIIKETLSVAIC